jgi:hypothetical protein
MESNSSDPSRLRACVLWETWKIIIQRWEAANETWTQVHSRCGRMFRDRQHVRVVCIFVKITVHKVAPYFTRTHTHTYKHIHADTTLTRNLHSHRDTDIHVDTHTNTGTHTNDVARWYEGEGGPR